jgi:hypothetical protein
MNRGARSAGRGSACTCGRSHRSRGRDSVISARPENTTICRGRTGREQMDDDLVGAEESILVVGHWQYIGRGHSSGEAIYARIIAHDLAESRRAAREALAAERRLEGAA